MISNKLPIHHSTDNLPVAASGLLLVLIGNVIWGAYP